MIALVWPLVRRVPAVVWAFLFALALGLGGLALAYRHGRTVEQHRLERAARMDSIHRAVIVQRDRRQATDSVRAMARVATRAADRERPHRQALRHDVTPLLPDLPPPVVQLIASDDALLRRDSIALEAHVNAEASWLAERKAADSVQALQSRQIVALEAEADSRHGGTALVVVGTVLGVLGLVLGVMVAR